MDASHRCRPQVFFAAVEQAQCMSQLILTFCDCFLCFCLHFCSLPQSTKTFHKEEHEQDKVLMKWTVASVAHIFFFLQKKSSRNPLSLSKIFSSSLLTRKILLLWLGDERTENGYSIHVAFCKALGIDIRFYVKSIKQWWQLCLLYILDCTRWKIKKTHSKQVSYCRWCFFHIQSQILVY